MEKRKVNIASFLAGTWLSSMFYVGIYYGFKPLKTHYKTKFIEVNRCLEKKPEHKIATQPTQLAPAKAADIPPVPRKTTSIPPPPPLPLPLLPPPAFDKTIPRFIVAKNNGDVPIRWKKVKGASKYRVMLVSPVDHKKHIFSADDLEMVLHNLGVRREEDFDKTFKIALASVNEEGAVGHFGETRHIQARRIAQILAPTVKTIRVED